MSTNENTPISGQFWDWMQSYWHTNRDFPPAHPDWRKKADLVDGKVPAGQLPSYVDDVLEFNSYADLPQSGEKGKIYITTKDNKQFRWGGSAYIEINSGEKVESKIINGSYNANDLSKNSITYGYSVANAPSTVGAHSFTVLNLDTTNSDYKMQLGFDGDTNEMFSRIKSNGNWSDWSKYAASSQLGNFVTTNTNQLITGLKAFVTGGGNYGPLNNALQIYADDGSLPAITFSNKGSYVGQIMFDAQGFYFKNGDNNSFYNIKSKGFIKNGSDDNYVLLGGGGHKAISDFATSTQLGNYLPLTGGSLSGPLSISTGGDAFFIQTSGSVVSASMYNSTADAIIRMQSKTNPFWDIISSSDGSFTIQNNSQPKLVINSTNFDFNGSSLTNINRVKTNGDIKHNNLGLTLANNAAGGNFSSVLIKTGLTTGNMGTFTVKLYRYAHDYYEFNINNYKYNNSNYGTNVTWKAGNSQDITRIEFLKDSNNVLYVNVVIPLGYPRIAVTDFMAYSWDDVAFDSSNWGAEFDGNTSGLINEGQAIPSDFKRDNYLASSSSLQNYVTLDTPQTIIANKNFAQTANVTFYGNEANDVSVWRNSANAGLGGVVSGHILHWYDSRWKVGNARSGDVASYGYAFWFSDNAGSTYNQKVIIGTDSNIQTSQFGMSSQWYDAYNKQIVNFTKTSNYIGDVYRLDKQDGSFIERAYYGIGIVDTRNVNNGLGSDGSDSFFPNANNSNLANKMTPIFHSDYFDSGDWKSSIIMRGWSGQYRAWRITGNASYGDNESDFYLSQSKASDGTWLPYRKIWTDRNLPNPVSQSQLNNYLPLTGGTLSGVLNLQNLNSLALNGGQIINAANGDTLYMGNPSVTNFYLESNNSDLLHNRSGYGVGRIWDEHNFKPDSKLNQTGASYRLDWDGATDNLYRDNVLLGYVLNSNNILGFGFVTQSNLSTQLNNYFNKFAIDYIGASHDLNSLSQTGFYNVGHGTVGDATSYLNNTGAKALLHLQSEDPYTALQIQSHRYNGNLISRSKSDGVFSTWIRHWGDNDFTAADMSRWNNSVSKSSASEEVILEDDTLKIQPDEFSLQGNSSYNIGSKKKLVHVLFREGKELNIRDLTRRQTIVVFNFSKDRINLNIEGLKPYPLSPEMQVTLYISDEGEVMLYNENSFKKLQ